jgi:hypothetical protein
MPTLLRVFVDCLANPSLGVAKLKLVGVMALPFWMKIFLPIMRAASLEGNRFRFLRLIMGGFPTSGGTLLTIVFGKMEMSSQMMVNHKLFLDAAFWQG